MTSTTRLDGPVAAATLRDLTATESELSERGRTLTDRTVEALWDCGLMQWFNPKEAGGGEPAFTEMIETWIELAWQDGSLGWIGIANFPSAAASAAYLSDEGFDQVFTRNDNRVTVGGQFFPNGLAEIVDGGYRLTGAWNFGSGTGHSQFVAAGFIPTRNGEMVVAENGLPPLMVAVIPHDEIVFTDGWFVQGLKGTGSYDYNVTDLFVPRVTDLRALLPLATPWRLRRIPDGPHPDHRGGARLVGARRVEEHARRRDRTGRDQGAHGRRVDHRQPCHVPTRALAPPGDVEGRPPLDVHHVRRNRARGRQRSAAHAVDARRHADDRCLRDRGEPGDRPVGSPLGWYHRHPRGKPTRARVSRHVHGNPARVHR